MRTVILTLLLTVFPAISTGAVLTVPASHLTIQQGIDAALPGDTVMVSPGIYWGPGNRALTFRGKEISLIGRDGAMATLIDCEGRGRGFLFHSGEDSGSLVRGFTVMNGTALGIGPAGKGAGIYCAGASPRIEHCTFIACEAWYGGALGVEWGARPTLTGCLFTDNSARLDGGALYFVEGGGEFNDCRLRRNRAGERGDDAFLGDSRPAFQRCSFQSPPLGGAQSGTPTTLDG